MRTTNQFPFLILQLILISTCGLAAESSKIENKKRRYINSIFENVDVQKNTVFGEVTNFEGESEKLLLDVYTPKGDVQAERPAILWIHGGGFSKGNDKSQGYIVKMATEFAKRGYVCISINYRVRDKPKEDKNGTMLDALEDAMSSLNWIRNHKDTLKIDITKIIVGGGSAGGRLAVNLCYKDNSVSEWNKSGIIGVVNLWGSPDDSWIMYKIDKQDPPMIIVHGIDDVVVPYVNSERLVKELEFYEIRHELIPIANAGHTPTGHMDGFIEDIAKFLYSLLVIN